MRRILQLVVLLLCAVPAFGQQTPVSATVIDPNGIAYSFSTGYASIACPGNQQPTFNGSPLTRTITISGFDGFGSFHMVLWDVNAIQPVGCGWQFMITWKDQITSFTTGIIGKSNQVPAITGSANVDLSAAISAFAPPLPPSAGPGGANLGPAVNRTASYTALKADNGKLEIFNGSTLTLTLPNPPPSVNWTIVTKNVNSSPLTISANGLAIDGNATESLNQGSSVTIYTDGANYFTDPGNIASSTPTINAIYASPNCPNPTPANCFQVLNDTQVTTSAIFTAGSTTVGTQNADPAFVSTDAGKIEFGTYNCPGTVSNCTDNCPQGTISSVTDAHHVVVSIACTNNSSAGSTNNWFWGHDDGPTLVSAFNVILNGSSPGTNQRQNLFLPCGMMMTSVPPFIIPAPNRNTNGGISGCGGGGATVIVPLPKMNCNTTGGCLIADNSQPLENQGANLPGWVFKDISFWGGGTDVKDAAATYSNPATGILTNIFDSLVDVWVIGWVWNNATTVIGMSSFGSQWFNSGSVAGGNRPCQMQQSVHVTAQMVGGTCGGSVTVAALFPTPVLPDGFSGVVTQGVFFNLGVVQNNGGIWFSHGDSLGSTVTTAGVSNFSSSGLSQQGSGTQVLTISGGSVHLNMIALQATGPAVNQTGGTIFDDCGNTITGLTTSVFTSVVGTCSLGQSATNTSVASRNTALGSTQLLPALRWPGPSFTIQIYAYDSAAGSNCTGNTIVTWTVSYTDPTGTAQTSTATETITTNGGATGGDAMKVTMPINVNANTVVNYSTTYTIGAGCTVGPSYASNLKVI